MHNRNCSKAALVALGFCLLAGTAAVAQDEAGFEIFFQLMLFIAKLCRFFEFLVAH